MMRCGNCGRAIRKATAVEIAEFKVYQPILSHEIKFVHVEQLPLTDALFCTDTEISQDNRIAIISKTEVAKTFL